jgi:hypothetical protein
MHVLPARPPVQHKDQRAQLVELDLQVAVPRVKRGLLDSPRPMVQRAMLDSRELLDSKGLLAQSPDRQVPMESQARTGHWDTAARLAEM